MGTKNISLTDEAYERLRDRKGEGESFTDVILRLTSDDPEDFSDLTGTGIEASWEDLKEKRGHSDADERREKRLGLDG
jgi:predicted CopG family antitoxin